MDKPVIPDRKEDKSAAILRQVKEEATRNLEQVTDSKVVPLKPDDQRLDMLVQIQNGEQLYITGTVVSTERYNLFTIPHVKGMVCASVPPSANLIMIARTPNEKWFNVIYTSTIGQNVLGWIQSPAIEKISLLEKEVNLLDLPITNFEYNNRDEVVELLKRDRKPWLIPLRIILGIITAFLAIIGIALVSTESSYSYYSERYYSTGNGTAGVVVLVIAALFLVGFILTFTAFKGIRFPKLERERINRIRRSKQSEGENRREDMFNAAKIAAGVAATGLAATVGVKALFKSMPTKTESTSNLNVNIRDQR